MFENEAVQAALRVGHPDKIKPHENTVCFASVMREDDLVTAKEGAADNAAVSAIVLLLQSMGVKDGTVPALGFAIPEASALFEIAEQKSEDMLVRLLARLADAEHAIDRKLAPVVAHFEEVDAFIQPLWG